MESPRIPDEEADFEASINHYKSIFFELSKDPLKTEDEIMAAFNELVKFVYEQFRDNPKNWEHYFESIVKDLGSEFAQIVYVEVCKIAGSN